MPFDGQKFSIITEESNCTQSNLFFTCEVMFSQNSILKIFALGAQKTRSHSADHQQSLPEFSTKACMCNFFILLPSMTSFTPCINMQFIFAKGNMHFNAIRMLQNQCSHTRMLKQKLINHYSMWDTLNCRDWGILRRL